MHLKSSLSFLLFLGVTPSLLGQSHQTLTEPLTLMEFVRIFPGEFLMGSPEQERAREPQETLHKVTIEAPFYLGRYEVTQRQWLTVMGSNPSWFQECGLECPVERVSYSEIQEFISRLNRLSGRLFRLPTEAEWEFACRAGTRTPLSTGDTLTTDRANFDGRYPYAGSPPGAYRESPSPVGSFPPNAWGLYDMHGNVWEWTSDWHCPYSVESSSQGGNCGSQLKVIRGGSWYFGADSARCALRYTHASEDRGFSLGFRLALDDKADAGGRD